MIFKKRALSCVVYVFVATSAASIHAADNKVPPVIRALESKGLSNMKEFSIGDSGGLRAFGAMGDSRPISVYVTPDGNAIVGVRVGQDGKVLDEDRLQDMVAKPMSDAIWGKLGKTTWIPDGSKNAPRIVYTFTDANCPYCHKFWEAARPWVDAGKVQLRHVMVGVIRPDSVPKAAAILTAKDRTAALTDNERKSEKGGIAPAASVPGSVREMLNSNAELMGELGFRGTPGIVYLDQNGLVQRVNGMPQGESLQAVLGPR